MKIDPALLSEENYSGVRRIVVSGGMITKYKKEIDALQKQAEPFLKKMEKITTQLDPFYKQINEHNQAINKLKEEMKPTLDEYNLEMAKVEVIEQKANAIKNRLQPIVSNELIGKLGEFEKPLHVITEKGIHYVEVIDEVEELIKAKRARKAKTAPPKDVK